VLDFKIVHKIKIMDKNTKPTAIEQALTSLRHDVLSLSFLPGTKLKVEELQHAYGLSSSPLREALNRLSEEGLVRADDRRGFRVAPVSEDDLLDITRLRLLVDLPALEESMRIGTDAWEARVVASFHLLEKVEVRLPDGPVVLNPEWSKLHQSFHATLISACQSERLVATSRSLFDQAERYRHISARYRTVVKRKSEEHKLLMRAVLKRDVDTACHLHQEHVLSTQKNALKALALWNKDTH
jgi:DNA-binding GntR family transcriptional regulator